MLRLLTSFLILSLLACCTRSFDSSRDYKINDTLEIREVKMPVWYPGVSLIFVVNFEKQFLPRDLDIKLDSIICHRVKKIDVAFYKSVTVRVLKESELLKKIKEFTGISDSNNVFSGEHYSFASYYWDYGFFYKKMNNEYQKIAVQGECFNYTLEDAIKNGVNLDSIVAEWDGQ